MLSRRSFAALTGAGLFGIFARIRLAPMAPKRRVFRGRLVDWGDFQFRLDDEQRTINAVWFRGQRLNVSDPDSRYYQMCENVQSRGADGPGVWIVARIREDGHIGVTSLTLTNYGGEKAWASVGPVWGDFTSAMPPSSQQTVFVIEYPGCGQFAETDFEGKAWGFETFGPNLV